jgi:hypothetical protein
MLLTCVRNRDLTHILIAVPDEIVPVWKGAASRNTVAHTILGSDATVRSEKGGVLGQQVDSVYRSSFGQSISQLLTIGGSAAAGSS